MNDINIETNLREIIELSKYFPIIKNYIDEDIDKFMKGMQKIKNKSRSKIFKHWQYLQCFSIFINYLKRYEYYYKNFKNLYYEDRNLMYGNFITALENCSINTSKEGYINS